MKTYLSRLLMLIGFGLLTAIGFAVPTDNIQEDLVTNQTNFNVPQEILDRLPEEQVAPFLLGRQRVLSKYPSKAETGLSVYEEINISRNAIARMPDDQLFQFFTDLKYIEVTPEQHAVIEHQSGSAPPSPEQLIQLLFGLIGGALLVVALAIYLRHTRKVGEQEIVLQAIENGEEIPLSIFEDRKQKSFVRWGILLLTAAATIAGYGIFSHISTGMAIIPGSIGAGFLLAGVLVKD